jgi:hypothetical protein
METKKETLEEAAYENCKKSGFNNTSYASHCMQSFIEGAKYQAERMYSEEEVYHILCEHTAFLFAGGKSKLTEWFNYYKKK